MNNMKKEQLKTGTIIGLTILIVLSICYISTTINISQENYLLKTILIADKDFSKISIDYQMGSQYYEEASYSYENGDYNLVESNCRLAREYYLEESQGYRRIKAELKAVEIEDKLIYLYIDTLDASTEMADNMFEACEHFESAVRYYDIYYNTDVPSDDMSYDMGGREINMMNEKIRDHDEAVERYNNLLEEFRVELERRIN